MLGELLLLVINDYLQNTPGLHGNENRHSQQLLPGENASGRHEGIFSAGLAGAQWWVAKANRWV